MPHIGEEKCVCTQSLDSLNTGESVYRNRAVLWAGFEPAAYRSSDTDYGLRCYATLECRRRRSAVFSEHRLRSTIYELRLLTIADHRSRSRLLLPFVCYAVIVPCCGPGLSLRPTVLRMRTTVYGVTLRWNAVVEGLRSFLTSTITAYLSHL